MVTELSRNQIVKLQKKEENEKNERKYLVNF